MARAGTDAPRWYAAPVPPAPAEHRFSKTHQAVRLLRSSGPPILAVPLVRLRPHAQFSQQLPRAPDHPRCLLQVGFELRSLASGEIDEAPCPLDQPVVQVVVLHDGRTRSGQIGLRRTRGARAYCATNSTILATSRQTAGESISRDRTILFALNAGLCGRQFPGGAAYLIPPGRPAQVKFRNQLSICRSASSR